MPTFRIEGILVVSLMGFTHHNSLFPGAEVQERLGPLLEGYNTTKGTIHFEKKKLPPSTFYEHSSEPALTQSMPPTRRNLANSWSFMTTVG